MVVKVTMAQLNIFILVGEGLFLSTGAKWFRNRKLLTSAFHFDILKGYINIYNDCSNVMIVSIICLSPFHVVIIKAGNIHIN